MSPPGSLLRKKKDDLCSPGVNGVWAARGYGNKCNRNSYKSSMSVWMLHFMLTPTRSCFGPNITDFVGFSPARLGHEKMEPFSFRSVSTFSITKHHSKSDSPPLPLPSFARVNISKLTELVSVLKKTSFEACTRPAQKLCQDQDPSAPNTEQGHCKSAQSLSQLSGKPAAAARTSPLCRFATFLCFCCALYRKAGDREISVAFTIWQGYNKSWHLGAKMLHLLIERQLPQIKAAAFYAHTSIHVMCLINISALLFSSFASTQLLVPTIRTGFTGQQLAGESSILLKGTQRDWPLGVI